VNEKLDAISDQLRVISEDLADIAIEALREAIDDKDFSGKRPEVEKRVTRARRAVDKAAGILNESSESSNF
jgi:hypothetical protein|tara:strand:- start:9489 stop:9701 length:213 start_codon:yes stop_codon:yes gene_type:complete